MLTRHRAVASSIRLTRREEEIAALVAQGTNKQIAAKLVVSERTAENYVLNILNKLGFNGRTEIASWATHRALTRCGTM
ncbi:MAG: response regulator transcription factor [Chloroflexi bacterium]|nr:MAG: response regulator transcription factor [Chloroflexota bacterium]TMF13236.1 MAG: response regulator transcription factor [Chloroflexota bacterium]